mmetsp:Transcript_800/g.1755  ORF Transcript_800/g.1755 Transcript_800/m.1755 type:complete len:384 (-) Transcript_800:254-1405(-)
MPGAENGDSRPYKIKMNGIKVKRSLRKTTGGRSPLHKAIRVAKEQWFILSVFAVILLAKFEPTIGIPGGPLKPEIMVKKIGVGLIFLISGLSLKTEELANAAMQVQTHATIQGFSLLFTPFLICTMARVFEASIFPLVGITEGGDAFSMLMGIKVLSCIPPPVSTGLILTKSVEGNEAVAIFNGTIGAFLGVVLTPLLVMKITGGSADVPVASIMGKLFMTVVLPLLVGQLIKYSGIFPQKKMKAIPFSTFRSLILLSIIYTTFCSTFMKELEISTTGFCGLVVVLFLIQVVNMLLVKQVCEFQGLPRTDVVAAMFCAVHKSLTLGMPITGIVFEGDPKLAVITIPLLIYHPMQILLGSLLVPTLKKWVSEKVPDAETQKGIA